MEREPNVTAGVTGQAAKLLQAPLQAQSHRSRAGCQRQAARNQRARRLKRHALERGEYAENEFRTLGAAVENEMAKRKPGPKSSAIAEDLPRGNPVDLAAKRSGFISTESFERAKSVTKRGAPEVIRAMDQGDLSISASHIGK
jgi:hypothetical protein